MEIYCDLVSLSLSLFTISALGLRAKTAVILYTASVLDKNHQRKRPACIFYCLVLKWSYNKKKKNKPDNDRFVI